MLTPVLKLRILRVSCISTGSLIDIETVGIFGGGRRSSPYLDATGAVAGDWEGEGEASELDIVSGAISERICSTR